MFVRDAVLRTSLNARNTITRVRRSERFWHRVLSASGGTDRPHGRPERPPVVVRTLGRWTTCGDMGPGEAPEDNRHARRGAPPGCQPRVAAASPCSRSGHTPASRRSASTQQSTFHSPLGTCECRRPRAGVPRRERFLEMRGGTIERRLCSPVRARWPTPSTGCTAASVVPLQHRHADRVECHWPSARLSDAGVWPHRTRTGDASSDTFWHQEAHLGNVAVVAAGACRGPCHRTLPPAEGAHHDRRPFAPVRAVDLNRRLLNYSGENRSDASNGECVSCVQAGTQNTVAHEHRVLVLTVHPVVTA